MASRYIIMFLLFIAAVLGPALIDGGDGDSPASPRPAPPSVPEEALEALKQGRYWRASRILGGYLAEIPDPAPASVMLAAEAGAGWGDWAAVERLLAGRVWLDTLASGAGWSLLGRSQVALGQWAEGERSLSRYLSLAPGAGDRERGLAEARRGIALGEAGQAARALEALARAAEHAPQIGDWLNVLAARSAARAGDTAAVAERLAGIDPLLAREWGWRLRVDARTAAGDLAGAEQEAWSAANALDDAGRRAEAWLRAGNLRETRGDTEGARAAYRRAMAASAGSLAAVDAARQLGRLGSTTADDQLRVGRLYLRHGNIDRGAAGIEAYLASGAGAALERAELRLELARAYFRGGRYAEAERRLLALADAAPSDRIAAAALFLAGRSQYRQGRADAGRATFLRTAERYPREEAAAEALFLLGDLDHDDGRLHSAREYYRRTAQTRPGINEAGLALMRLGGMAYLERDFTGAATIFEEYRRLHPDGRRYQQATYWAARSYEAIGESDLAAERLREVRRADPFSWYSLRAADRLGAGIWEVPLEPSPPRNATAEAEVATGLLRLDLLRELGLDREADFEVERLKNHFLETDGALYALAEAFNARGYTMTGIRLGWEIYRREGAWNPRLLRIIYPFPYRNLIIAEARERGLDPFFVAGLIRQESMFIAAIKSPAGAIGLMQVMPRTGQALAGTAGIPGFAPGFLEQPEVNLHLGMAYVAELMARYGDRITSVLAAYNAGPHRVSRWSAFPEYDDEELFAERIPFAETREYVKIVQQNARIYAALYGDSTAMPAASNGE